MSVFGETSSSPRGGGDVSSVSEQIGQPPRRIVLFKCMCRCDNGLGQAVGSTNKCLSVLVPVMHLDLHQQGGLDGLSRPRFCSPTRPMKLVGRLVHEERHSGRHFVGWFDVCCCSHSIGRPPSIGVKSSKSRKENEGPPQRAQSLSSNDLPAATPIEVKALLEQLASETSITFHEDDSIAALLLLLLSMLF